MWVGVGVCDSVGLVVSSRLTADPVKIEVLSGLTYPHTSILDEITDKAKNLTNEGAVV